MNTKKVNDLVKIYLSIQRNIKKLDELEKAHARLKNVMSVDEMSEYYKRIQ